MLYDLCPILKFKKKIIILGHNSLFHISFGLIKWYFTTFNTMHELNFCKRRFQVHQSSPLVWIPLAIHFLVYIWITVRFLHITCIDNMAHLYFLSTHKINNSITSTQLLNIHTPRPLFSKLAHETTYIISRKIYIKIQQLSVPYEVPCKVYPHL